ncbi:MAG: penicillin-binding protein 1A [Fibrobacterota bacterium]
MSDMNPITFSAHKKSSPSKDEGRVLNRTPVLIAVLIVIVFTTTVFLSAAWVLSHRVAATLPDPGKLSDIRPSLVSTVYDMHGEKVHDFSIERRFWKPLDSFPEHMQNAVIAIEDIRFRNHWGIDVKRIAGAIVHDIAAGGFEQGASTLTQQLARNAFFSHEKRIIRKIREAFTAVALERYYTKDEILELYLNMVYLGGGVYGVEAASQLYFSKPASQLTVGEAALLAGCIQSPGNYRPDLEENRARARVRRNSVLRGMVRAGFLSKERMKTLAGLAVTADPAQKESDRAPYFVEEIRRRVIGLLGEDKLYHDGIAIHTTLDTHAQDSTEKAVKAHLDTLQRIPNRSFIRRNRAWTMIDVPRDTLFEHFDSLYDAHRHVFDTLHDSLRLQQLQTSVVTLDNANGAVRVLVGGRDFKKSKFNRATQSTRQPGSAFKPFVYTAALKSGYTPATIVNDKPVTIKTDDGDWRPENFDKKFYGEVPLQFGLKKSLNLIAIQLLLDIGAHPIVTLARSMGIEGHLPYVPALAIGAGGVKNINLTTAFSVFPAGGVKQKPYFIDSIVNSSGRTIYRRTPEVDTVLSPGIAAVMTTMMEKVVDEGTGVSIRRAGFRRPCAGKTGTTNDYSDAWFVGFTPQYSCGVWTGFDQRRSMGRGIAGSKGAIPIWVEVMKAVHGDSPEGEFPKPESVVERRVCSATGMVATDYCPEIFKTSLLKRRVPGRCDEHTLREHRDSSNVINFFGSDPGRHIDDTADTAQTGSSRMLF